MNNGINGPEIEFPLLVLISAGTEVPGEPARINRLFEAGLPIFHLRKKGWPRDAVADLLGRIGTDYHRRIVVHDHFDLAEQFDLAGIHLGESTKGESCRERTSPVVSAAFHSLDALTETGAQYRYCLLSPVFDSISKSGYPGRFNTGDLQSFLKEKRTFRVLALAGIDGKRAGEAMKMGFDGIAVLGYIWSCTRIAEQVNRLKELLCILKTHAPGS